MKGALAVAAAEIRRHRLVAGAGLLVGCLPMLLSRALDGGLAHAGPQATRPELGNGPAFFVWVFALVFAIATGSAMGFTAWAGDLREGRLGFWLSRPVPLVQYWAGKVLAAFALASLGAILVLVPAHLLGVMSWGPTLGAIGNNWRVFALPVGLCLAAAIFAGGAVQARTRLLALDLVMIPTACTATLLALGAAWQGGTGRAVVELAMPRLLVVVIAVLLVASAAQVCLGRLDLPRGHALLSAIGWGGLLVCWVGGIAGFSRHVAATTSPEDLRNVIVASPASGDRVLLWGMSRTWSYSFAPGFLLHPDGRTVEIGGLEGASGLAWSPDGGHLALSRERFGPTGGPGATWRAPSADQESFMDRFGWGPSLEVRGETTRRHRLGEPAKVIAVSPGGGRLLLESESRKSILDARSGEPLASLEDSGRWLHATFVDATTVRALRRAAAPDAGRAGARVTGQLWQGAVTEWDAASGRTWEGSAIALQGDRSFQAGLTSSEDGQRVLRFDTTGLFLHDRAGGVAATLVDGWSSRGNRVAGSLSWGRYGCVEEEAAGLRLRVFEASGRLLSDTRLAGRFPVRVGGEPRPGWLALGVNAASEGGDRATLFVDLATGAVARRQPRLSPALRLWMPESWPSKAVQVQPGSFATRLFTSDDGLVTFDPETAATAVLIARHGPSRED